MYHLYFCFEDMNKTINIVLEIRFINREELRQEWSGKQEKLKSEEIEITYSYWDGSGHRRQVRMKKGNSMQQFLQRCLEHLRKVSVVAETFLSVVIKSVDY